MTTPDRFPVPVRSAVKSNLTSWCNQNLSNRAYLQTRLPGLELKITLIYSKLGLNCTIVPVQKQNFGQNMLLAEHSHFLA